MELDALIMEIQFQLLELDALIMEIQFQRQLQPGSAGHIGMGILEFCLQGMGIGWGSQPPSVPQSPYL